MATETTDYYVTSDMPFYGDNCSVECQVLIEPGPASFIWEGTSGESDMIEAHKDSVLTRLGFRVPNLNVTTFEEPLDIPLSIDDLLAAGIDFIPVDIDPETKRFVIPVKETQNFSMESFDCSDCGKSFHDQQKLRRHRQLDHGELLQQRRAGGGQSKHSLARKLIEKSVKSLAKSKSLSKASSSTVILEKKTVGPKKPSSASTATCRVCQAACSSKAHLALHMMREHSTKSSKTSVSTASGYIETCCLCNETFRSKLHLETHTRQHTNETPLGKRGGFECTLPSCSRLTPFSSLTDLLAHVETAHAYGCRECPEHFATTDQLVAHNLSQHLDEASKGVSNVRSPLLTTLSNRPLGEEMLRLVKETFRSRTSASSPATCSHCKSQDTFKTLDQVREHFLRDHPYRCPLGCNKVWKFRSSIRKHYVSFHKDSERPHHCDHCLDLFGTAEELRRHLVHYHKQICGPPSTSSPPLKSTDKLSPSLKPKNLPDLSESEKIFQCPECEKGYHHPDSIRKHCRKVHKILVLNCRHCFIVFREAEEKAEHFAAVHAAGTAEDEDTEVEDTPTASKSMKSASNPVEVKKKKSFDSTADNTKKRRTSGPPPAVPALKETSSAQKNSSPLTSNSAMTVVSTPNGRVIVPSIIKRSLLASINGSAPNVGSAPTSPIKLEVSETCNKTSTSPSTTSALSTPCTTCATSKTSRHQARKMADSSAATPCPKCNSMGTSKTDSANDLSQEYDLFVVDNISVESLSKLSTKEDEDFNGFLPPTKIDQITWATILFQ